MNFFISEDQNSIDYRVLTIYWIIKRLFAEGYEEMEDWVSKGVKYLFCMVMNGKYAWKYILVMGAFFNDGYSSEVVK